MKNFTYLLLALFSLLTFEIAHSQNVLSNGSFETGLNDWMNLSGDNGSKASFTLDTRNSKRGSAMKVFVKRLGDNPWDIQSVIKTKLKKKKNYRLTFYAKSRFPQSKFKAVVQNEEYMEKIFDVGVDYRMYTWDFRTVENVQEFKFQFFENGTYFIDEIVIEKI